MLRDTTVVVAVAVVRTRPQAMLLAMITMRTSIHGFPFVSHIWVAYGALLGRPKGRRSSAMNYFIYISHHFIPHRRYELNKLTCSQWVAS